MCLTLEQIREYATHLILEHAQNVEFLTVHEMWPDFAGDAAGVLHGEDAEAVADLIPTATITVSWPETGMAS